jgi:hypothetical protein
LKITKENTSFVYYIMRYFVVYRKFTR